MKYSVIALLVAAVSADCVDDKVKAAQATVDGKTKELNAVKAKIAACAEKEKAKAGDCPVDGKDNKADEVSRVKLEGELKEANSSLTVAKNTCQSTDAGGAPKPEKPAPPAPAKPDVPKPAEADLAKDAKSQAAQAVTKWDTMVDQEKRQKAEYDKMTDDKKKEFDEQLKAESAAREKKAAAEKVSVGYDKMTTQEQANYLTTYRKWREEVYGICKKDAKDPSCENADKLRAKQVEKQVKDKYFAKSDQDRATDDKAYAEQKKKDLAEITAAAKPKGTVGKDCSKVAGKRPDCSADECCGTATEPGKMAMLAKKMDVCAPKTNKTYKHTPDGGGAVDYNFACIQGAKNIAASVVSVIAATYIMA